MKLQFCLAALVIFFFSCHKKEAEPALIGHNWTQTTAIKKGFLLKMSFSSPDTGYLLGLDSNGSQVVSRTTDKGQSWNVIKTFDDIPVFLGFAAITNNSLILSRDQVYSSSDGGYSWIRSTNPQDSFHVFEFEFKGINAGYALGSTSVYKKTLTRDWTSVYTLPGAAYSLVQFTDSLHGFVAGGNFVEANANIVVSSFGLLSKTNDGGKSWIRIDSGSYLNNSQRFRQIIGLSFVDNQNGFIVTLDQKLWATHDGGITWTVVNNQIAGFVVGLLFISTSVGYYTIANKIYTTVDGGKTFTIDEEPLSNVGLIYSAPNNTLFVLGTNGLLFMKPANK